MHVGAHLLNSQLLFLLSHLQACTLSHRFGQRQENGGLKLLIFCSIIKTGVVTWLQKEARQVQRAHNHTV